MSDPAPKSRPRKSPARRMLDGLRRTARGRRAVLLLTAAAALVVSGAPALAALPDTDSPTLSLNRTIRTVPFVGTSLSTRDGEGTAFVPNDPSHPNIGGTDSLWLVDDNSDSAWE